MFDIGTQELIIIFIVALLVFGPKKLPELARTLGKGVRELKSALQGIKDNIDDVEQDITKDLKQGVKKNVFTGDLFDLPEKPVARKDKVSSTVNDKEDDAGEKKELKAETGNDG